VALAYPWFRTVEPLSPYLPENLRQGLVLYLWMNEGSGNRVYDLSGNGNHATIYGATWTRLASGKNVLHFDGVDDYVVVGLQPDGSGKPFTVYGWSEITIEELIYPVWPKANALWSRMSMIGDHWRDRPSTGIYTDNPPEYTRITVTWTTRKIDGTPNFYGCDIYAYRNSWVHVVRRFTASREYSVWVNGVRAYSASVPSTEATVLEWNPDTATYPARYKRFVLGANVNPDEWMTVRYGYVRIYSRALSDAEIRTLYELHRGLFSG